MDKEISQTDLWIGVCSSLLLFVIIFPLIALKAYVLSCLWAWYVMPKFNLPALGMPYAFGLSLIVSQLVPYTPTRDKERVIFQVLSPIFVLIIGWIGTWFL